jgi:hypothetical protein
MDSHIESIKNLILKNLEGIDLNLYQNDNKILSKSFEYYWAILMSEELKEEWYPYKMISPEEKDLLKLPLNEFGIDLCNKKDSIGQVKLYREDNHIGLDDIATFLLWKLKGWKHLFLCKNKESSFTENVKSHMSNEFVLKETERSNFIQFLKNISKEKEKNIFYKEHTEYIKNLRSNFLDDQEIEKFFKLFEIEVQTCLSIPFGIEKVILDYIEKCNDNIFLMVYHNSVSKYEIENNQKLKNLTLVSYQNFSKLEDNEIRQYKKIFIMDAHRIHPQDIYEEDDKECKEEEDEYSYLEKIRKSVKTYENIVLASHHIEHVPHTQYYRKSLRKDFIDKGKILSYEINCKFYETNPSYDKIIEDICIKNLPNHMIIYSLYESVGIEFTERLNNYLPGSAVFVNGKTPEKDLVKILDDFKEGKIRFLVNPKLLEESYIAPICDSILILKPSSRQMYFTSIFNRGLLYYPNKKFLKIYMVQTVDNAKDIYKILKICSRYDDKLERDIENIHEKKNRIVNIDIESNLDEYEKKDKYEKISMEIIWAFGQSNTENNPIEWLIEYDKINGNLPQDHSWLIKQQENFINGKINSEIFKELCRIPSFFRWIFEKCDIVLKNKYNYPKDSYMPSNQDQIDVIYEICVNRKNSIIQGSGGVGKSVCIVLISCLCRIMDIKVYRLAYTGCAAHNINGVTIDTFFKKERKMIDPKNILIIIDEYSMVSKEKLEEIDNKLKKYTSTEKIFGGIQLSFFGDFAQLPPINSEPIFLSQLWDKDYFYYKKMTKVLRQKDEEFISVLNNVNKSNFNDDTKLFIENKTTNNLDEINGEKDDEKSSHIFWRNDEIENFNENKLKYMKNKGKIIYEYKPILDCKKDKDYEEIKNSILDNKKTKNILKPLRFCKESIVIINRNIDTKNGICNGARAHVLDYNPDDKKIRLRLLENNEIYTLDIFTIYDSSASQEDCDHDMIYDNNYDTYYCKDCGLDCPFAFKKKSYKWKIHTFPIELNWATSVYKVQGKTISSKCFIHLPKKGDILLTINSLYVAFSRPRIPQNLYIVGELDYVSLKHKKEILEAIEHGFLNRYGNDDEKDTPKINTWIKDKDKWCIKLLDNDKKEGDIVNVTRKDGTITNEKLGKLLNKYKDYRLFNKG